MAWHRVISSLVQNILLAFLGQSVHDALVHLDVVISPLRLGFNAGIFLGSYLFHGKFAIIFGDIYFPPSTLEIPMMFALADFHPDWFALSYELSLILFTYDAVT